MKAKVTSRVHVNGAWVESGEIVQIENPNEVENLMAKGKLAHLTEKESATEFKKEQKNAEDAAKHSNPEESK